MGFSYAASRKTKEVWFSWNRDDTSWGRNLEYRWEGRHVFVTVRLEPVKGTDPELWERYLRTLKTYHPYDLLDEAYRYVSEGGELTEGMVGVIRSAVGVPIPGHLRRDDRDARVIELRWAIVRYCERDNETSRFCSGTVWASGDARKVLEGQGEGPR